MRYARLVATTLLGMLLCAFPASYFTGAVVRAARARKSLTRNQAIVLPQLAVLTPFFPQLAAPNPAPKTEVYRTCTEHFMGSIRKAEFSQARYSEPPSTAPTSLGPFGPVGGFRLAMAADSCPRLNLWLANCYFAHDSSGFPVLLPFFDAPFGRSVYPFLGHAGPPAWTWGVRSLVAESLLLRHQLLILNRSRQRSPNLSARDRILAGWMAILVGPTRLLRSFVRQSY